MKRRKRITAPPKRANDLVKVAEPMLPPGVVQKDTVCPSYKDKDQVDYNVGSSGTLTFYDVVNFGWCIATLTIKRPSRRHYLRGNATPTDRTYAMRVSTRSVCRIGLGPHVKRTVTIHLRKSRLAALKQYIDLYNDGAVQANVTRDRISSRRAEGSVNRSLGRRSWLWSS